MTWRRQVAPVLSTLCLTWCIVIGFVIWFTPVRYSRFSNGASVVIDRQFSEVSRYGALPLIVPALIAGFGTWGAWRGWRLVLAGSALLLGAFAVISGFSIGGAYLPATGLQLLAVAGAALFGGRRRCRATDATLAPLLVSKGLVAEGETTPAEADSDNEGRQGPTSA